MIKSTWKFHAARQLFTGDVDLHIAVRYENGRLDLAAPLTLERLTEDQVRVARPPCVTLPIEAAQSLMDELWTAGLRPSEGTGSAGSLAATERHLADMRTLAFHALKVPK